MKKVKDMHASFLHPSIKVNLVLNENVLAVLFLFLWAVQFICRNAHLQR